MSQRTGTKLGKHVAHMNAENARKEDWLRKLWLTNTYGLHKHRAHVFFVGGVAGRAEIHPKAM